MASSSTNEPTSPTSPHSGPFQRSTHARVIKLQEKMKDILQLLTEIQVSQLRMAREQQRQGNIIRNVQKFLMDNRTNPINIEDSSQAMESEEEEPMEEPQEDQKEDQLFPQPEVPINEDESVIYVGEILVDTNGNIIEQRGNFCLHYPNCSIHKSPIVKDRH